MKKLIFKHLLLAVIAFLCSITAKAYSFEFDGVCYAITSENEVSVSAKGEKYSGDIVIPEIVNYDGKAFKVTSINTVAFEFCHELTSISIPKTIKAMYHHAFYGCENLTAVYINDLSSWCEIDHNAYSNPLNYAHNLYLNGELVTNLVIPSDVTEIKNDAFECCNSLKSVKIHDGVTAIGNYAFQLCESLTEVKIDEGVKCVADYAFYKCPTLASINIPNSVTSIGNYAFAHCEALTSAVIGDGVTKIGENAFLWCNSLENLVLGNNLTDIGDYSFAACWELRNIIFPNSLTNIGIGAFSGCNSLASVIIPEKVTKICDRTFDGCSKLSNVTFPESITSIGDESFQRTSLTSVEFPKKLKTIGSCAFYSCLPLSSVTIPKSVTSIGGRAFYDCKNLNAVHIEDLSAWCSVEFGDDTANPLFHGDNLILNGEQIFDLIIPQEITEIKSHVFAGYGKINTVTIHENVNKIGYHAFCGVDLLTAVYIDNLSAWCKIEHEAYSNPLNYAHNLYLNGELITDLVIPADIYVVKDDAFECCTCIKSVTIHDSVTSIGNYAFQLCDSLSKVTIGKGVVNIGDLAFNGCFTIEKIVIPNTVETIGNHAFNGCNSLSKIKIGQNVESIGEYAFQDCLSLGEIDIPDNILRIEEGTFKGCTNLANVTLGSSVIHIDDYVFANCNNLQFIHLKNANPFTAYSTAFSEDNYANTTLYVPKNSLESYKAVSTWKNFADIYEEGSFSVGCRVQYKTNDGKVVKLNKRAFGDAKILSNTYKDSCGIIEFSVQLKSIGETAFYNCINLTNIEIPNSVKNIERYAFRMCSALESVEIPYGVQILGPAAFEYCTGLHSIKIPESVTCIGEWQFAYCNSLENVILPNSLTEIEDYSFHQCTNLKKIIIPSSIEKIGFNAFYEATGLTAVHIDNLSAWCKIEHEAYSNPLNYAHNLYLKDELVTDLVIPDDVTIIKNDAFEFCTSLKSVTFHDNVTFIENYAFQYCSGLKNITMGECVESIGNNAFFNCDSLMHIYRKCSTAPTVGADCFSEANYENVVLHVPNGTLANYNAADTWMNFKNIVEYDVTSIDKIINDYPIVVITTNGFKFMANDYKSIAIYTTNGALVEKIDSYTGEEITLDKGVYFVRVGNKTMKVKL